MHDIKCCDEERLVGTPSVMFGGRMGGTPRVVFSERMCGPSEEGVWVGQVGCGGSSIVFRGEWMEHQLSCFLEGWAIKCRVLWRMGGTPRVVFGERMNGPSSVVFDEKRVPSKEGGGNKKYRVLLKGGYAIKCRVQDRMGGSQSLEMWGGHIIYCN